MLLHSLSLEEWLATLTKVKGVSDRATGNFTAGEAEEAEKDQESEKRLC